MEKNVTNVVEKHVFNVYDAIANDFDRTRKNPVWPSVQTFLLNNISNTAIIDNGAIIDILEIGFGNGKNLEFLKKSQFSKCTLRIHGCDTCKSFVDMVSGKLPDANLVIGDQRKLPFPDNSMNVVMSIAVLHHLDSKNDRIETIQEMWRVLKQGGKMMIQVWAMEQPKNAKRKFEKQDSLVTWKSKQSNQTFLRYYHLFVEHELELLVRDSLPSANIDAIYWQAGNWICEIRK